MTKVFTIGFTQRSAREFFETLREERVRRLVDVRLKNVNQLTGFSKRGDLEYFLHELCGAEYVHEPRLAPSPELFDFRRKQAGDWDTYARRFLDLLAERRVEDELDRALIGDRTVLLCTEASAEHCHRRLVLQYLGDKWEPFEVVHL